jgi:hypothetical protein
MLNADSSTLKSDVHRTKMPPTTPRAAAFSWIWVTKRTIVLIDVRGKSLLSSVTRTLDSSARSANPKSASDRKSSGTKASSAK